MMVLPRKLSLFTGFDFLLYINNPPSCLSPKDSSIILYADDILQQDINKIVNWISDHHLTINIAKTKCMTISRLRLTIPLQVEANGVNGHQIEEVVISSTWVSGFHLT